MRVVLVPVVCSCGWHGALPTKGPCPACRAPHQARVSKERLTKLREIAACEPDERPPSIEPIMRKWLTAHKLIAPADPRLPPTEVQQRERPMRRFVLTDAGRVALAAQEAKTST